jgi:hypothetical protein
MSFLNFPDFHRTTLCCIGNLELLRATAVRTSNLLYV